MYGGCIVIAKTQNDVARHPDISGNALKSGREHDAVTGQGLRKCSGRKCFRALCCKGPPPPRPEYDVVCIGLTGAGKTSLLSRLCSEGADDIVPTTGFSIKAVPFQNAILNVKELGGADTIKKYWSRYYQGSQGVVFVLDSASSEEDLEVARTELHSALQHPQLCTLPFLILANHQDKPAARSVQEVTFHTKHKD
ncbi:hypothetical protein AAFF_G00016860 [Aldrovandia affinis]|uniref:ADP-ribosylation factor-like protein 15 n=1 Tax=Aldrovandia affinis TaxID=143900 RepID=A0AAD7S645_9TELE|nr:hypothetical protein AAFF_G00016860 [Aldrovandia affinis]